MILEFVKTAYSYISSFTSDRKAYVTRFMQEFHDLGQKWLTSSQFSDDASSSDHSSESASASDHFSESSSASCNSARASDHSFGSAHDHNLPSYQA
jgi:hypothetical protein